MNDIRDSLWVPWHQGQLGWTILKSQKRLQIPRDLNKLTSFFDQSQLCLNSVFIEWGLSGSLGARQLASPSSPPHTRHFSLHLSVCAVLCLVAQLCLTLCNPMDCSPPSSSDHEIISARTLEWVSVSGDLPDPAAEPTSPCLLRWQAASFTAEPLCYFQLLFFMGKLKFGNDNPTRVGI